jgi:hypothetical protein
VRINPIAPGRFRAVTHLDITAEDIEDLFGRVAEVVQEIRA